MRAVAERQRVGRLSDDRAPAVGPGLQQTLHSFFQSYLDRNMSNNTLIEIRYYLGERVSKIKTWKPLASWAKEGQYETLASLDREACSGWLEHVRNNTEGPAVKRKSVLLLRRFLNWAVEEDLLPYVPIKLREPKVTESEIAVFSHEEMQRMTKVAMKENVRDQAIFALLLDTGLRSGEVCSVTLGDIRFEKREIVVQACNAKNGRSRTLPMKGSYKYLRAYAQVRGDDAECPYFFLSFAGSPVTAGGNGKKPRERTTTTKNLRSYMAKAPLTIKGMHKLVKGWGLRAKVTEARCSPHTFRHFFAVEYLRHGGDVFTLKDILGHSKLDMTLRYAKLAQVDVKRVHATASPALRYLPARQNRLEEVKDE